MTLPSIGLLAANQVDDSTGIVEGPELAGCATHLGSIRADFT
ncbi:MAG: hypothetical protein ACP5G7_10495 [Anaerolineae bacterium]